jgi:tetratricopeptide (TPR) repeat protein
MESRKQSGAVVAPRTHKTLTLVAALLVLTLAAGCAKLQARDQLNKGVQAYKANKFETAIEHFKNAIQYDPGLTVAKLYLATACSTQYVPGADNAENKRNAECAIEQFQRVLEDASVRQQDKVLSLKGLASLYLNMSNFDKAKEYNRKAIEADPNDADNYYSIAVIDWTQTYKPRIELRTQLGLKDPTQPIKDKKACEQLKEKNLDKVEEGIQMLTKALEIRKDYDDAMAYINLLYRERADLHCDDPAARDADNKTADDWVEKAKTTRQAKAEKAKEQHGIVLDQTKPGGESK